MASGDEALQTLVLKVSIHCHGCKKKVRKVLRGIQGVHDVKIDAHQHKVTVTGTVDAETLVRRLHKSGKQALMWQHAPAKPAEKPDAKAAPASEVPEPAPQGGDAAADKKPEEPVKEPPAESSEEKHEVASEKKPDAEEETEPEKEEAKEASAEAKKDGGESDAAESKAKDAEPAKEAGNDEGEAKKKTSEPKYAGEAEPVVAPPKDRALFPPPRHAHEAFNPYGMPQPVMSYHMAQPRTSVSYYAPQLEPAYSMQQQPPQPPAYSMQQQQQQPAYSQQMQQWSPSYLHMPYPHASPESYYRDYYGPPGTHASPPMHDSSYRLFDDENPSACSVM